MKVRVTRKSGDVDSVDVDKGSTVKDVLAKAKEDVPQDHKVILDGRETDLEAQVQEQSIVVVQQVVAGGGRY